jgi:hypothetical protein
MLFNNFSGKVMLHIDDNFGKHQCGFQLNYAATNQTFCIWQISEEKTRVLKKRYSTPTILMPQNSHDSIRSAIQTPTNFGALRELVRPITIFSNEQFKIRR